MTRVALIGATGLVGRQALPLLERRHDVLALARRDTGAKRQKLGEIADWPALLDGERVDVAISALGTTWRQARSWDRFAAVDEHGVLAFAAAAQRAGARQMIAISSVGADPGSRSPYLALKGRVEQQLAALGFDRLDVLRPGLLVGDRGADRRFGERIGIALSPLVNRLLVGRLDRYRAIDSAGVAAAVSALTGAATPGCFIHHNREIARLAATYR